MLSPLISLLKKHKEKAAFIGLGLGLVVFVGSGIYLRETNSQDKGFFLGEKATKIELQVTEKTTAGESSGSFKKTSSFFFRPSPAELLEQLSEMENLQEDVAQARFASLPVLWQVFFFNVEPFEDREIILLDISEDGFGIQVRGKISSNDYPYVKEAKRGEKVWVAGEITAVDLSGTGTVYLDIELLDFSPDGPPAVRVEPPAGS